MIVNLSLTNISLTNKSNSGSVQLPDVEDGSVKLTKGKFFLPRPIIVTNGCVQIYFKENNPKQAFVKINLDFGTAKVSYHYEFLFLGLPFSGNLDIDVINIKAAATLNFDFENHKFTLNDKDTSIKVGILDNFYKTTIISHIEETAKENLNQATAIMNEEIKVRRRFGVRRQEGTSKRRSEIRTPSSTSTCYNDSKINDLLKGLRLTLNCNVTMEIDFME